jgi:hypothetical protein
MRFELVIGFIEHLQIVNIAQATTALSLFWLPFQRLRSTRLDSSQLNYSQLKST